jgi:hypothetical protein
LKGVLEQLGRDAEKVAKKLSTLAQTLFHPNLLKVQVSANILDSEIDWKEAWVAFCPNSKASVNIERPHFTSSLFQDQAFKSKPFDNNLLALHLPRIYFMHRVLVGLAATESSFLLQTIRGPVFGNPEIAPLQVLIEYFCPKGFSGGLF